LLDWWLAEIQACLGKAIDAVLVHGSIALDDFCSGWSDIDVCVVLHSPVSETQGDTLGSIHDRMQERFIRERQEGWVSGQVVEGYYIPHELVSDAELEMPCYTAGGTTRQLATGHPVSPFDRYMLAHHAHTVMGTPLHFAPPDEQSLLAQTRHDLADLRKRARSPQSSIWLCGELHWLARCLVFWRDGQMLSKSTSLQREMERGSVFSEAFRLALQIRREGSLAAAGYHESLQRVFQAHAMSCAAEIDSLLSKRAPSQGVAVTG